MQFSQLFSLFWCPWDSWLHTVLWEVLLSYFCWCWVGARRRQLLVSGGWWYKCNLVCFKPEVAVLSLHQLLKKSTVHFLFSVRAAAQCTQILGYADLSPVSWLKARNPLGHLSHEVHHIPCSVWPPFQTDSNTQTVKRTAVTWLIYQLSSTVTAGISWTGNASCPQLLCSVGWYWSRLYMYLNNLMLSP